MPINTQPSSSSELYGAPDIKCGASQGLNQCATSRPIPSGRRRKKIFFFFLFPSRGCGVGAAAGRAVVDESIGVAIDMPPTAPSPFPSGAPYLASSWSKGNLRRHLLKERFAIRPVGVPRPRLGRQRSGHRQKDDPLGRGPGPPQSTGEALQTHGHDEAIAETADGKEKEKTTIMARLVLAPCPGDGQSGPVELLIGPVPSGRENGKDPAEYLGR